MKIQIVERELEDGSIEYGVQHHDGHINWYSSLPQAAFIYNRILERKKNKADTC
jgi:hypothetical protein